MIAPRPMAFFDELRLDSVATPTAMDTAAEIPAAAETVAAVTATVREAIACANARDIARYFALHTERGIGSFLTVAEGEGADRERALAELRELMRTTPVAAPEEERSAVYGVREVVELPDDRVAALVDLYDISARGDATYLFVLVQVDGRWLIDHFSVAPAEDALATPAA